jgi:hypothetical protein
MSNLLVENIGVHPDCFEEWYLAADTTCYVDRLSRARIPLALYPVYGLICDTVGITRCSPDMVRIIQNATGCNSRIVQYSQLSVTSILFPRNLFTSLIPNGKFCPMSVWSNQPLVEMFLLVQEISLHWSNSVLISSLVLHHMQVSPAHPAVRCSGWISLFRHFRSDSSIRKYFITSPPSSSHRGFLLIANSTTRQEIPDWANY